MLQEKIRLAVRYTLIAVLDKEVNAFVSAGRYERSDQRRGQHNGTYAHNLGTSVGPIENLPVPVLAENTHLPKDQPVKSE